MSLDNVLDFIGNNLQYSYLLILLFAFAESLVVVGSILSSAILFSICVFLYNNNLLDLYSIVPLAMIGAHAGDVISFVLGKRFGPFVLETKFFKKRENIIERGNNFIDKFGQLTVVLGRFIPAMRAIVPFLIGMTGMEFMKFYRASILAISVWGFGLIILTTGLSSIL